MKITYHVMFDDYTNLPRVIFYSQDSDAAIHQLVELSKNNGPTIIDGVIVGGRHYYMIVTFEESQL